MAKKKFSARAKLVKGASKWYIDYTLHNGEKSQRKRCDFRLNEIENLELREAVGVRIAEYIEVFAPPYEEKEEKEEKKKGKSLEECLQISLNAKNQTKRKNTKKTYGSHGKIFISWAKQAGYANKPVENFTKKYVREFFDFLQDGRELSGRTLNNYRDMLGALWSEMIDWELTDENPWKKIKPAKQGEKKRRMFTDEERRTVAGYIRENDYWLFRALLLQFYCYLRPVELARLKGENFDLARGLVKVRTFEAKTWRERTATIPYSIIDFFRDGIFDLVPARHYVFGCRETGRGDWEFAPSAVPANENRMYKRHRRHLENLKMQGKLETILGLTWYSWKDTGISMHAAATTAIHTRDQAGHAKLETTMLYYHSPEINSEYAALNHDLFL